jgi:cell division protein FtsB
MPPGTPAPPRSPDGPGEETHVTGRAKLTERRELRRLERRRRRGGHGRGPVALQRAARGGIGAGRRAVTSVTSGDRPFVAVLAGVLVLSVLMLSGPAQRLLDTRERVETLAAKADALERENAMLERRMMDLEDPLNVELLAREQQGFIRPGEVPYTLVPPAVDRPRITAPRDAAAEAPPAAWYTRAWQTIRGWSS